MQLFHACCLSCQFVVLIVASVSHCKDETDNMRLCINMLFTVGHCECLDSTRGEPLGKTAAGLHYAHHIHTCTCIQYYHDNVY